MHNLKLRQVEKDERHKLIWDFQREIIKIYEEHELTNLAGLDMEFMLNDRQILAWFFDTVNVGQNKFPDFDFHKLFDDLIFCSDEILHFTALLYLYRPYLQNPIEEGFPFADGIIYPTSDTIEVKRYNMFSNSLSEKVYNYWDRIGDLIATYFPELIDPKKVYFTAAIDIIPEEYKKSENYAWLKNFRDNEFADLNRKRKEIVHYVTLGTSYKWKHAKDPFDKKEIERLVAERHELSDYFKKHIKLTQEGFERTVLLIDEITKAKLTEQA